MPYYAGGEVAVSASGLDLIVTRVSKGTVLAREVTGAGVISAPRIQSDRICSRGR